MGSWPAWGPAWGLPGPRAAGPGRGLCLGWSRAWRTLLLLGYGDARDLGLGEALGDVPGGWWWRVVGSEDLVRGGQRGVRSRQCAVRSAQWIVPARAADAAADVEHLGRLVGLGELEHLLGEVVLGLDEVLAAVEGALALALRVPAQVDVLAPVVLEHALASNGW